MKVVVIVDTTEPISADRGDVKKVRRELHTATFDETEPITTIIDWANTFAQYSTTIQVKLSLDRALWGSDQVRWRKQRSAE